MTYFQKPCSTTLFLFCLFALSAWQQDAFGQRDPELKRRLETTLREYCTIESVPQHTARVAFDSQITQMLSTGTRVQKGDLIVKLNTSVVERKLADQRVKYETARAELAKAKTGIDVAKRQKAISISAAAKAFQTSKLALENFSGPNGIAESELEMLEAELSAASAKLEILKLKKESGIEDAALPLIDVQLAVDNAKKKLAIVKSLHHPLKKAELESVVAKQQAEFELLNSDYELELADLQVNLVTAESVVKEEKQLLDRLTQQVSQGAIISPTDGFLKIAQSGRNPLAVGSSVRTGQVLAYVVDGSAYRARVLVNETRIRRLRKGQEVKVGLPSSGRSVKGVVSTISRFPEPTNFLTGDTKTYAVEVQLEGDSDQFRDGMSALAEIKLD